MNLIAAKPIRVFLADDHKTTLWGLEQLLASAAPRMQLVGTATNRADLLAQAPGAKPDVIVLDLDLGGEDACTALPQLRRESDAQILVLTGERDCKAHEAVVMLGARGVVQKSEEAETLLRAIEKVYAGEIWLNRSMIGKLMGEFASGRARPKDDPEAEKIASLTVRERQTVTAVVRHKGAKSMVIAEQLHMSEHTLRNHLTTIYSKLGVRGRLDLFVYASEHGLARDRVPAEPRRAVSG